VLAEIKSVTGVDADLISAGGGIFEVKRDDVVIFSKHALARFPRKGEVAELLDKA